jgi:Phospholipase_D-nuclease N-terminal
VLFEVGGVVGFLLLAFWIWALVDCISSDPAMVRNLPKLGWIVIVILLFDIGAILWLLLGRPLNKHWRPTVYGETDTSSRRLPSAEDRTRFAPEVTDRRSAELDRRLAAWEQQRALESGTDIPRAEDEDLAAKARELDLREAELRRRELELRARELDAREQTLDDE